MQVNTSDIAGGAAKIAWQLFQGYPAYEHKSWLAVGDKLSNHRDVFTIANYGKGHLWSRLWWRSHAYLQSLRGRIPSALWLDRLTRVLADPGKLFDTYRGIEDFRFPGTWNLLALSPQKPDIIHCHNLHGGYFDLHALPWLSQQAPVVLTLHDAWLLSGHCAHSFDCERWKTGCGSCPDLAIPPAIRSDATAYNWQRKREIYDRCHLYVATPSCWLMQKVEKSMLAPTVVEARVIPNGVDLSIFHPAEQHSIRSKLNISLDAKMLLFTANGIRQSFWKDYQTMRATVALVAEHLPGQNIIFIALGEEGPTEQIGRAEVHFIPYQKDPTFVARYYQAADVYLHAAKVDTFPNTVLEALACGTPVVATAVGGIPEQVKSLKHDTAYLEYPTYDLEEATGILVPPGDAQRMAVAVNHLLDNNEQCRRLGQNAVRDARQRFSLNRQVEDYLNWYQEILKSWPIEPSTLVSAEKKLALSQL